MRGAVLVLLAGCGRVAFDRVVDDAAPDTSPDGDVCATVSTRDWALWPMPNTRDPGLPHQPSYAPGATTVIDNVTGLVWQRAVDPGLYAQSDAEQYCSNLVLDGHCDWRLPTRVELISIVGYVNASPAIDPVTFPATPADKFWTQTVDVTGSTARWYVDFTDGLAETTLATDAHRVRCVRGGTAAPMSRYDVHQQTVADTFTGLTWERAVDAGIYNFANGIAYCNALVLDGTGWRMPSIGELQTLVDSSVSGPSVDPMAFPSSPADLFWTGSLRANATTDGWTVNFVRGVGFRDTGTGLRVRCVR